MATSVWASLRDGINRRFGDARSASEWLERNRGRVEGLFKNVRIRDFVFEPIKGVFQVSGNTPEDKIRSVITQVAVANAVLAGLPGKMGVGVVVSIGLEGWMAWTIAQAVGIKIESTRDIWKYFGLLAGIAVTILVAFKMFLGFGFSLFSAFPGVNPLILAELLVTNLVGVLFWYGFQEARRTGQFSISASLAKPIWDNTVSLFKYQAEMVKSGLSPSNLRKIGLRLVGWLKGEVPTSQAAARGEILATACMGYLLMDRHVALEGELGQVFIESIRDRFPELADASVGEIAAYMREYGPEQLAGAISLVKGRMFEQMVIQQKNSDGDSIKAESHPDMNHPGSDIILTNEETGETIEVSLKATDSPHYIESALSRYPDTPIMTTDEVAEHFGGNEDVIASGISNAHVQEVTQQNFDKMLAQLEPVNAVGVAAGGVAGKAIGMLWPFVVAYLRKRIDSEQLEQAFERTLGESGVALASRISYAVLLGPVFAWYLLARGVMGIIRMGQKGVDTRQ